jgi:glucose/arabinose dehydrogenase
MMDERKGKMPAAAGRLAGFFVILGLILSACEVIPAPAMTQAPTVSPIPSLSISGNATSTVAPSESAAAPTETTTPPTATTAATTQPFFPDPAGYEWTPVITGLDQPVDIQNAGDGSGRLFVVEKAGRIVVLQNGQLLSVPFLDIRDKVNSRSTERGLLGLAFHPDYRENGLFFVNYIDLNGNTVIARFHVSAQDPNQADPSSEVDLIHIQQPYPNHNGGSMVFGPDGTLYMGLGDGGSAGDPQRNGQNLQTLLGKILRIDVGRSDPYSIPADNPFAQGGGLAEIWAYGLRNPWRFSFDRATGNLYIADVGQDAWEEVDFVAAGTPGPLNFGWSYFEGLHPFHDQPPAGETFIEPVVEYSHSEGCSITGGYVYRGGVMPAWQGIYLYGDYCSGNVWGLIHGSDGSWQSRLLFQTSARISSFGVDEAEELYLADLGTGDVLRLSPRQ